MPAGGKRRAGEGWRAERQGEQRNTGGGVAVNININIGISIVLPTLDIISTTLGHLSIFFTLRALYYIITYHTEDNWVITLILDLPVTMIMIWAMYVQRSSFSSSS